MNVVTGERFKHNQSQRAGCLLGQLGRGGRRYADKNDAVIR